MDIFKEAVGNYKKELMAFLPGSVFLLFILYKINKYYNLELILELSTIERLFIFILLSLILGKLFYTIGKFFIMILSWLIFQRNKKKFISKEYKSLFDRMSFSAKKIEGETTFILPEILCYIESQDSLKKRNEDIHSNVIFWETMVGGYLIISSYYLFLNSFRHIIIHIIILLILLILCLYYKKRSNNLWHDCALSISRGKKVNE